MSTWTRVAGVPRSARWATSDKLLSWKPAYLPGVESRGAINAQSAKIDSQRRMTASLVFSLPMHFALLVSCPPMVPAEDGLDVSRRSTSAPAEFCT